MDCAALPHSEDRQEDLQATDRESDFLLKCMPLGS
jgi:hypothetical protein